MTILFDFIITRGEFSLSVSGKTCNGITVFLGPSGAGKSTLLNCLSGNLTPNNGDIKIGCNTVFSSDKRINLKPEKRKIGLVRQDRCMSIGEKAGQEFLMHTHGLMDQVIVI
mgnify:CR=1 FL=1